MKVFRVLVMMKVALADDSCNPQPDSVAMLQMASRPSLTETLHAKAQNVIEVEEVEEDDESTVVKADQVELSVAGKSRRRKKGSRRRRRRRKAPAAAAPSGWSQTGARCKVEQGAPDNLISETLDQTLQQCTDACDNNADCVAFEFEPANGECELVNAVNLVASVADGVADGGDGGCTSESCCYSKALAAPAGYSQSGARCKIEGGGENAVGVELQNQTLEDCKAACDSNGDCVAFEYERANGECELANAVNLKASVADGVADGSGDGRCNGDSCCYSKALAAPAGYSQTGARCKIENEGINGIGVELQNQTLDDCKDACDANADCVAFEFERANGECEFANAVNLVASVADGVADGGDGRCNGDSCCYSKALAAPAGYSHSGARCKIVGNGDNAVGVELQGQTLDECKVACDGNADCVAFEFERANGECELANAVDLSASEADGVADGGDGKCNGDSCCYSRD